MTVAAAGEAVHPVAVAAVRNCNSSAAAAAARHSCRIAALERRHTCSPGSPLAGTVKDFWLSLDTKQASRRQ